MNEDLILDGRHLAQAALRVAETLLKHPRRPAALIGSRDAMALTVPQAAGEIEVKVPEELALGGIDDIEIAAHHNIRLTAVSRHAGEMAELAATWMIEIVQDAARFAREPFQHVIRPTLMVRRACGAAG